MNHALKVLEFESVRQHLAQMCETTLGAESALALTPDFDPDTVWSELDRTRQAYTLLSESSPPSLGAVRDLREQFMKASKGAVIGGGDLFTMADAMAAMRSFRAAIGNRRNEFAALWALGENLPVLTTLEDQLFSALDSSGEVKDSASQALATLRRKKTSTTSRIMERVQSYTSGRHRELLSDPIYTVRDGRYVIPLKVENRGKVRGIVHDTSSSGQTLFVEPEDVLQLGNQLREVEAAEREEILRILTMLSAKVGKVAAEANAGIEAAGEIDFLLSKARLAYKMKANLPQRWQGYGIHIEGGRHPLLKPEIVVPLDLTAGFDFDALLITGPNTGGKTVAIKTIGLFVLMAQSGLYLPARDVKLGSFSQVWADIGDEQSLEQSLSTFSGHIKNIAEAMAKLKKGALALFDEIGAGTDPAEGAALAKSILLYLQKGGAIVVASTHYGELKAFAYNTPGYRNAAMEFDVKSLAPTYRLLMGAPGASHALKIAERYGLPKSVVDQAREGMSESEQQVGKMLEQLEIAQKHARVAQGEADRKLAELKRAEAKAAEKLAEAEDIRKNVHARASETIDETLREIRAEAAQIFEELKQTGGDSRSQAAAREKLKNLQEFGSAVGDDFKIKHKPATTTGVLQKGMSIRVDGYNQIGVLLEEPKEGSALVQLGPMKLTVDASKIRHATGQSLVKAKANIGLQRAQSAVTEVHLRAMRAEEAVEQLERFIDDAVLAGLGQVRIVHGKGEGILRKVTQEYLRKNKNVSSFRDGEVPEGGQGVTIAVLK